MTGYAKVFRFSKMHGLGNDFVIIDSRNRAPRVTSALARALGDRHSGIGFDQLAEITGEVSQPPQLAFFNADGSASATCGNATRCIARMLMDQTGSNSIDLQSERGLLRCHRLDNEQTAVNMGAPLFNWEDIPLAYKANTLSLPIEGNPVAVGLGNPHCVLIVKDPEVTDVESLGPKFERHPIFPERSNVEFVSVSSEQQIRMRVWERGVGITRASGSGACAAAVACARRGLVGKKVVVVTDGGELGVNWTQHGITLSGPTSRVFDGELAADLLDEIHG